MLRPLERKVTQLEEKIVKLEGELKETQEKLVSTRDPKDIAVYSNRFKDIQDSIDRAFAELETVTADLDRKRSGG